MFCRRELQEDLPEALIVSPEANCRDVVTGSVSQTPAVGFVIQSSAVLRQPRCATARELSINPIAPPMRQLIDG